MSRNARVYHDFLYRDIKLVSNVTHSVKDHVSCLIQALDGVQSNPVIDAKLKILAVLSAILLC